MTQTAKATFVDLEVQEVSLVGNPANPPSQVTLFKSAEAGSGGDNPDVVVTTKTVEEQPAEVSKGDVCRLCETKVAEDDRYCRSCGAPFYRSGDPAPQPRETVTMADKNDNANVVDVEAIKAEAAKAAREEFAKEAEKLRAENAALRTDLNKAEVSRKVEAEKAWLAKHCDNLRLDAEGDESVGSEALAKDFVEMGEERSARIKKVLEAAAAALTNSDILKQAADVAGGTEVGEETVVKRVARYAKENGLDHNAAAELAFFKANPAVFSAYRAGKIAYE